MSAKHITVSQQLLNLHKTPIFCGHKNCNHKYIAGEKAIRHKTNNPRYHVLKDSMRRLHEKMSYSSNIDSGLTSIKYRNICQLKSGMEQGGCSFLFRISYASLLHTLD